MSADGQASRLANLTSAFYERTHRTFSATRQHAWQGWEELWSVVGAPLDARTAAAKRLRVADIACGNLRFVRFLTQKTKAPLEVEAFDGCEPLLMEGLRAFEDYDGGGAVGPHEVDIVAALQAGHDFMADAAACDLVVAFGFLHHVPTAPLRERLLRLMVEHTAEGGFLAASFWQFADDDCLRRKAEKATARAQQAGVIGQLVSGDYVLGWQDDDEALRFCHHFTEQEIDALSVAVAAEAEEVARFSADGKSGDLNRYVVWRRHG